MAQEKTSLPQEIFQLLDTANELAKLIICYTSYSEGEVRPIPRPADVDKKEKKLRSDITRLESEIEIPCTFLNFSIEAIEGEELPIPPDFEEEKIRRLELQTIRYNFMYKLLHNIYRGDIDPTGNINMGNIPESVRAEIEALAEQITRLENEKDDNIYEDPENSFFSMQMDKKALAISVGISLMVVLLMVATS